jgi:hypothetical protein
MAFFADDALVRQEVVPAGLGSPSPNTYPGRLPEREDDSVSLAGRAEIAPWVHDLLARHHRMDVGSHQSAGDRVSWTYQAFVDPYQQIPGVPPVEGTAQATVAAGHITSLAIFVTRASAEKRDAALAAAAAAAMARYTPGTADHPSGGTQATERAGGAPPQPANTQDRTTPSPAAWGAAVVLALLASGLAAAIRPDPRG